MTTLTKIFNEWKKSVKNKFYIISFKKLFSISRNEHDIAAGYDIRVKYKKKTFKRYIIIQGKAVQIIFVILCKENNSLYTLMVEQLRIGSNKKILEFPSGSVRYGETFKKAAVREVAEETGIEISPTKLKKLSSPVIMQPVNSYLKCQFYGVFLKMSKIEIKKYNNKKTGEYKKNEICVLKTVKIKDVEKMNNDSSIIGLKLLEKNIDFKNDKNFNFRSNRFYWKKFN